MLSTLVQIRSHIRLRGLGISIFELKKLCTDHHLSRALADIESLEEDYALLTRFFAGGFDDPERENLYRKLERRLYVIVLGMMVDATADCNPTFKQCRLNAQSMPCEYENIEETLSRYDQELAIASLDADADGKQKEIHQRLLRYRIFLFNLIYTSMPWSQGESEAMTKVLLSPLVDVIDQQIILGAMLMAQRSVFDAWKFRTLCDVAAQTDNVYVRSRALVDIALAMPDEIDQEIYGGFIGSSFDSLLAVDGIKQIFTDIQIQLYACMDTQKDVKTIRDEIMPSIMEQSKKMMDKEETDEEKLEALINPDKEERIMEEIDANIERMRKMQKRGADVFFNGFSQAKRFPFFYTLMNWFCPFYIEHPQVATSNFKEMPLSFMKKIIVGNVFCNSDKYSFVLSLAQTIHMLPKEISDLMQSGEAEPVFDNEDSNTESFIRRSYLNDLYRFFNLYTDKNNYRNPFLHERELCFFADKLFVDGLHDSPYPLRVCRQMIKRRHYDALEWMILHYSEYATDLEWLKIRGLSCENGKQYNRANFFFEQALSLSPDNKLIISHLADNEYLVGHYDKAYEWYDKYIALSTEEDDTDAENYSLALCELKIGKVDDGMKRLFRLSYNDPDDIHIRRALAWGYMLQHKFPEALNTYEGIDSKDVELTDILRMAIAQWMNHKTEDAVRSLKRYMQQSKVETTKLVHDNNKDSILDLLFDQLQELKLQEQYTTEAFILIDLALIDR